MHGEARRPRILGRALALAAGLVMALPASILAGDFPRGWEAYHTYAEVAADVAKVEAAHPDIVKRFSIGTSYRGRQLWAVKITADVHVEHDRPEVLFDGGHHADEHMGVEMTLRILHWLADGYGRNARITRLVDTRVVWIVFLVNPDGAEYDIAYGRFHHWRKNRQPTPGTRYIGTDLNRNYDYHWGGGGRTSSNPAAITYRGPRPFSAPETRALRDFLASRVIDGRQRIRAGISFHESGRLVMWPYGYTRTDVPRDMTTDDHAALVKIGRSMAATNGYRPEQASDLYITSGTSRDYEYGLYRTFVYTFEMSITAYPRPWMIASETGRNKEAILRLIDWAWCPLAVLGTTVRIQRCGAFDDDLEVSKGWTVNPDGTDTAPSTSRWIRGDPQGTTVSGQPMQLASTVSGARALVTGWKAGSTAGQYDLDGTTTARSGPVRLPNAAGQKLLFRWNFAHGAGSSAEDGLKAIIEAQDGTRTVVWSRLGGPALARGGWRLVTVPLDAWQGTTIHIRFVATDGGVDNVVEAAVDDVRVTMPS
jgi:hypothetical protein